MFETNTLTWKIVNLLLAAAAFVGLHLVLSGRPLRSHLIARMGQRQFLAVYSLAAFGSLVWTISAYRVAPVLDLWRPSPVLMYVPLFVMPITCYLVVGGYLSRNPMTVGQAEAFERKHVKGVLKITRHPVMWGIALWAAVHLAVNGDLASVILFGALLALVLVGAKHIEIRRRRTHAEQFAKFRALTSFVPFAAIFSGRERFAIDDVGWTPLLLALVLYVVLILLHQTAVGVLPWPQ